MITKFSAPASLAAVLICGTTFGDEVRGFIDKVDPAKQELTVVVRARGPRGLVMSFKLDKAIRVHTGRQVGDVADLQPGERARVFFEYRNGERVAVDVAVRGPIGKVDLLPAPTPIGAPTTDPNAISGVLQRVALTDREIVVIGPGPKGEPELESTLMVPEDARISKDGKPLKLEDLKEGERVVVHAEKRGDKMAAVKIEAGSKGPPTPAPNDRIERLRQVLRLADYFLQQLAEQRGAPKP
jgi:hypothetical protein